MKTIARRALVIAIVVTGTVALMGPLSTPVSAQAGHTHTVTVQQSGLSLGQSELLSIVRQSTERFKDVIVAQNEGYQPALGCVSGPDSGAMGLHYIKGEFVINTPLLPNGEIDPTKPQAVIYEPLPGGGQRLVGTEYVVIAEGWDKAHPGNPPQLKGQLFHFIESPNRFGLPPFYELHVWAWKENPNGAFVNWHPEVSCQSFAGQN
jgi:hypothetical protein